MTSPAQHIENGIMDEAYNTFFQRLGQHIMPSMVHDAWRNSAEFRNARLQVRDTLNGKGN